MKNENNIEIFCSIEHKNNLPFCFSLDKCINNNDCETCNLCKMNIDFFIFEENLEYDDDGYPLYIYSNRIGMKINNYDHDKYRHMREIYDKEFTSDSDYCYCDGCLLGNGYGVCPCDNDSYMTCGDCEYNKDNIEYEDELGIID